MKKNNIIQITFTISIVLLNLWDAFYKSYIAKSFIFFKNHMKYVAIFLVIVNASLGCKSENYNKKENSTVIEKLDDYSQRIDSVINLSQPRSFNGLILITENGKTVYYKSRGFSDVEQKVPFNITDNFRIQSNSKQMTAVLILREVEKGLIDLDKTIEEYLPDFNQSWANQVTIHHLMNMSSGIKALDKPLIFEPGSEYKYCNPCYGLLGQILESTTGKSFIELVNELFEELAMKSSYCYELDGDNPGLVNSYRVLDSTFNKVLFNELDITKDSWKKFVPAGGIISNAKDLNKWDIALHNGAILDSVTYSRMINYSILGTHAAFGNKEVGYGYGVRVDKINEVKVIGHGGRGIGFTSLKFYIPETDVDVIILENVYNEDEEIIYYYEDEIRKIIYESSLSKIK